MQSLGYNSSTLLLQPTHLPRLPHDLCPLHLLPVLSKQVRLLQHLVLKVGVIGKRLQTGAWNALLSSALLKHSK